MNDVDALESLVDGMLDKDKLIRELRSLLVIVDEVLNRGADFQCGPKGRHATLKPAIKAALARSKRYAR